MRILKNGVILGLSGFLFIFCSQVFYGSSGNSLYAWIGYVLLLIALVLFFISRTIYDRLPVAIIILGALLAMPTILAEALFALFFCTYDRSIGLGESISCPIGQGVIPPMIEALNVAQIYLILTATFVFGLAIVAIGFVLLCISWLKTLRKEKNRE